MSALIPAPGAALATLPESARTLAAASLTTNTRRAYSGALAAYLATLHDAGRAPAVAGQAVAAAKLRAKLAGQPLRRMGGARLAGSAMRQSSPSCPMQCSGFPKSPPSIAPTLPPKRTDLGGSPSGTRKQTKRARAPCSS